MEATPERGVLELGKLLEGDELADFFWNCHGRAHEWFDPTWKEGGELYDVYAGESLTAADKRYLAQTKRIPMDAPFAAGIVDTIMGAEMSQAVEVQFKGTGMDPEDEIYAEWMNRILKDITAKCSGNRHQRSAYQDMLVTGYGFEEVYLDQSKVPIRPVEAHIEVSEVFPDPDAVLDNLTDATFFIRERDWPLDRAQARWPEQREEIKKYIGGGGSDTVRPTPQINGKWSRGKMPNARRGSVRIFEFHYSQSEERVVYVDPDSGEKVDATVEEWNEFQIQKAAEAEAAKQDHMEALAQFAEMMDPATGSPEMTPPEPPPEPEPIEEQYRYFGPAWFRAYIVGSPRAGEGVILENERISINEPLIKAVTGYKWKKLSEGRVRFYGVLRKIRHIQLWLNRALATYLEVMARDLKGGGFIKPNILGNISVDQFQKNAAIPGYWHVAGPDADLGADIKPNPVTQAQYGFSETVKMMIDFEGQISGVGEFLKGTFTGERSNVLVSNLQEQGLQMLLPIREPRTAFLMQLGKALIRIALKHLPVAELDRMLGNVEVEGMTHVKQPNPTTGEEEMVPLPAMDLMGEPVLDEETGEPIMATPGYLLKQIDPLRYDVTTDVGQATPTQRQATYEFFSQHGLIKDFLESGAPPKTMLPLLMKYAPIPGADAKAAAEELRQFFEQQEQMQTSEGVVQLFQGMSPEEQQGLLQQLMEAAQPPAEEEMPEQTM